MTTISDIFKNVLEDITPTQKELDLIKKITNQLIELLTHKAKQLQINYTKIEPQGSTGIKQTQLRNDFDIDLFVGLNYDKYKPKFEGLSRNKVKKQSKKDFLDLCKNWIIKSLTPKQYHNPRLLYAEHPYVTVDYFTEDVKLKIDIVLYFDLEVDYIKENGPITAVDRSPWHGRFVRDNLTSDQKDEVRLLKQFFKANHSYGDKSAVGKIGFIGYSAELLIYYYETLESLFDNFHSLRKRPMDYYHRSSKELNKIAHFQNDYIIITDPIDKNRNVASAISKQAYKYCNHRIQEFLKHPHEDFFIIKDIPEVEYNTVDKSILDHIFVLELKNKDKNVHYTVNRDKLHSLGEAIKANGEKEFSHAERFGNNTFELYFDDTIEEYNLAIYVESIEISEDYLRKGPPLGEKAHAERFKKKNPDYFEQEGFLWVKSKREFTSFFNYLKDFIKGKIPENFELINLAQSSRAITRTARKSVYVLITMVLPFE